MTDSINFLEHTEEGTLVELKGNIHYIDGKATLRIADMLQILRLYNGMYKNKRKHSYKQKPKTPVTCAFPPVEEECVA